MRKQPAQWRIHGMNRFGQVQITNQPSWTTFILATFKRRADAELAVSAVNAYDAVRDVLTGLTKELGEHFPALKDLDKESKPTAAGLAAYYLAAKELLHVLREGGSND